MGICLLPSFITSQPNGRKRETYKCICVKERPIQFDKKKVSIRKAYERKKIDVLNENAEFLVASFCFFLARKSETKAGG